MKNIQLPARSVPRPAVRSATALPRVAPGIGRWGSARPRPQLLTIGVLGIRSAASR